MTPRILDAISSIRSLLAFLDLIRIAVLSTTVSMAFRPAAFIVSPDSAWISTAQNTLEKSK